MSLFKKYYTKYATYSTEELDHTPITASSDDEAYIQETVMTQLFDRHNAFDSDNAFDLDPDGNFPKDVDLKTAIHPIVNVYNHGYMFAEDIVELINSSTHYIEVQVTLSRNAPELGIAESTVVLDDEIGSYVTSIQQSVDCFNEMHSTRKELTFVITLVNHEY